METEIQRNILETEKTKTIAKMESCAHKSKTLTLWLWQHCER